MRVTIFIVLLGLGLITFPCGRAYSQETESSETESNDAGSVVEEPGPSTPPPPTSPTEVSPRADVSPQNLRPPTGEKPVPGDPTIPSEAILRRLPQGQVQGTRQQQLVPLPPLADIRLRGIVLSDVDSGTALVNVGGRQVSIKLKPRDQQRRVPIPQYQFLAMRPALEQRLRLLSGGQEPPQPETYEMCLECSFVNEGVVYNVEAFNSDTLMLQALPHNEWILVRAGNSP